jgi:hypothetical protein
MEVESRAFEKRPLEQIQPQLVPGFSACRFIERVAVGDGIKRRHRDLPSVQRRTHGTFGWRSVDARPDWRRGSRQSIVTHLLDSSLILPHSAAAKLKSNQIL